MSEGLLVMRQRDFWRVIYGSTFVDVVPVAGGETVYEVDDLFLVSGLEAAVACAREVLGAPADTPIAWPADSVKTPPT